jgi:hypothetical protein
MASYPAKFTDEAGEVRLEGEIDYTDPATSNFALLASDSSAFTNVTKPTIANAAAADIITALVTLGLVIDGT